MDYFPRTDPIPLPAPVWLFKVLHNLTFTAHMAAVDLLLGGLMLGLALSIAGRMLGNRNMTQTAGMLAHRLPTVMALLINLGVPPLLFAQVLYGRALYTSSVLIGAYWISVIFLLMASYYGLYYSAKRAGERQSWNATGLAALLLILTIAFIYSTNMTLMLRPQVWAEMYRNSPGGLQWSSGDPTLWPRWFFFVLGSFAGAGPALMLLAQRRHFEDGLRTFLLRTGGFATLGGVVAQGALAMPVLGSQPAGVVDGVLRDPLYLGSGYLWAATAAILALAGVVAATRRRTGTAKLLAVAAAVTAFLNVAATVLVRDGIRDVTLRLTGFEVWDRQVVTNWSVVGIFVLLLVLALVGIGYLISVIAKAKRLEEHYA